MKLSIASGNSYLPGVRKTEVPAPLPPQSDEGEESDYSVALEAIVKTKLLYIYETEIDYLKQQENKIGVYGFDYAYSSDFF